MELFKSYIGPVYECSIKCQINKNKEEKNLGPFYIHGQKIFIYAIYIHMYVFIYICICIYINNIFEIIGGSLLSEVLIFTGNLHWVF